MAANSKAKYYNFGKNEEGLNVIRINGTRKELDEAIQEIKDLGYEVYNPIEIEKAHKEVSVLLKLLIPEIVEKEGEE
jgi:hypothetical protein